MLRSVIAATLRAYPFYSGYSAIALSKPLALFARAPFAIATLRDGQKMVVHTRDHVGRTLLYMGDYEPRMSALAKMVLRPGDCVLDIGANLGWFSLLASKLVGPSGRVHAFEPQPRISSLLEASLAMNATENVTLHKVALSDSDGIAEFHVLSGNFGAGRLGTNDVSGELWSTMQVGTVEAGPYLDGLDLPHVRLVKIDVEGHEETVFRAAEAFFRSHSPDAIMFESGGSEPLKDRPVSRLLGDYGYDLFSFNGSRTRLGLVPAEGVPRSIDHLALRRDLAAGIHRDRPVSAAADLLNRDVVDVAGEAVQPH